MINFQAKCALISAHEQIKKLQTHSDERSTEFELIRSEKQKISEDLESTKMLLSELENSSKNKEKILLERTKKMESELSEASAKVQVLEGEKRNLRDEMRRKLDENSLKERNEFGLKLSIAERRATQAETDLLRLKQQLRVLEEESEIKKRPSIDQRSPSYKVPNFWF